MYIFKYIINHVLFHKLYISFLLIFIVFIISIVFIVFIVFVLNVGVGVSDKHMIYSHDFVGILAFHVFDVDADV